MSDRLTGVTSRLASVPPLALALALTATTVAAAGTITFRHGATDRPAAAARIEAAPSIQLPPPPAPAALPHSLHHGTKHATNHGTQQSVVRSTSNAVVPPARHLVEATLLVTSSRPLSSARVHAIKRAAGVTNVEPVAAGHARIDHHHASVLGVNPATFRPWTPSKTSNSQKLWESIARGELTASFDMGNDAPLTLGATVPVAAKHRVPMRIGAFASVGMAGVDAVVTRSRAQQLGLRPHTGVVVSAPHANAVDVRDAIRAAAGSAAHVLLLRQVVVVRDAGEFLTRDQIESVLNSAASRIGKPYVWGATGPDAFDCSGLVQWSFAQAGIRMPRVSQQQWFAGPHVSYADALPGDLLFWHNDPTDPGNIDHVAIYAGNGMMIAAPHTGLDVMYEPVPMTNFAGVVRVDPSTAAAVGW